MIYIYMIEHDLADSRRTGCLLFYGEPASPTYTQILNPLEEPGKEEEEKSPEPVEKVVVMVGKPIAPRSPQLSKMYSDESASPTYLPKPTTDTSLATNPKSIATTLKNKVSVPVESTLEATLLAAIGTSDFIALTSLVSTQPDTTPIFITTASHFTRQLPTTLSSKASGYVSFDPAKSSTSFRPIETSSLNTVFTSILSTSQYTAPVSLPSTLQVATSISISTTSPISTFVSTETLKIISSSDCKSQSSFSSVGSIPSIPISSTSRNSAPVSLSSILQNITLMSPETSPIPSTVSESTKTSSYVNIGPTHKPTLFNPIETPAQTSAFTSISSILQAPATISASTTSQNSILISDETAAKTSAYILFGNTQQALDSSSESIPSTPVSSTSRPSTPLFFQLFFKILLLIQPKH